jgi:Spy/CpxP family protein refolding chaperone
MRKPLLAALFSGAALFMSLADANAASPYAGQEARDIKALSAEDVQSYLSGKGMGFAKVAELNGYPGPSHVLALSIELGLTADQKQRTESLFKAMETKAIELGRPLVNEERRLDQLFATRSITEASLDQALGRIATLQAQVRRAHLEAHLAQVAILTPAQVAKYNELRGYTGTQRPAGHSGHKH